MTIKQLHELLPSNHRISIDENGCAIELWRESPVSIAAYGDFVIAEIRAIKEANVEVSIKVQPVKENT